MKQIRIRVDNYPLQLWSYTIFICVNLVIFLSTGICTASRTHVVYWDPDNIIFQTKPAPLLYVQPRDEVIFVCPYESLYILWTYERNVLDTCSMWLNNTMIVDLLLKCTQQFTHRSHSRPDVEEQRGLHKTTFRVCNHSCDQNQQTIQSTRSFGGYTPQIAKRNLVKERNLTIYHSHTKNRSRRSLDNVHVAKFTLLIDELSWANGNPRFVYNRPVFFIAQSAVCLSKNMRLVIVYGQYCFDSPINTEESAPIPRVASTYCPNSQGLKSTRASVGDAKKPEITNYRRAILPPMLSDERSRARVPYYNLIMLSALFVYLWFCAL